MKMCIRDRWWHVFRDPTLDSLISQALANNRDLAVAYSRVEEADRQIAVARAGFLPSFGVGVSAEGDYNAETKIVQKYAVEPQMTWEVSLFGALRNSTRAARAELLSSQWALRGVMLSLTAEVATTYFQLLGYRRNLRIAERSYALRRESAALIDSMYRHGMANGVALQQARSLVSVSYTHLSTIPRRGFSAGRRRRWRLRSLPFRTRRPTPPPVTTSSTCSICSPAAGERSGSTNV